MKDHPQFDLFSNNGAERGLADSATRDTAEIPLRAEMPAAPTQSVLEGKQVALFDKGEWWENHWKGMPEFVQENLEPFKTIYVHFEKREDMEAFAKLVSQKINLTTKSIWYPEQDWLTYTNKRWVDSLPDPEENTEELIEGSTEVLDEG